MRLHLKPKLPSCILLVGIFTVFLLCAFFVSVLKWEEDFTISHQQKIQKFSIAELMGSSNVFEVVLPNVTTIISQPSTAFVKGQGENTRPFAVIVVTSMAKYFNRRRTIRLTWYKWASKLNIRVLFMIGFHDFSQRTLLHVLEDEQRMHNDLIIDNFEEGYYRLPGKVLRMLKWYNATYSDENAPRFFIKTDQDVFINLPNLVLKLQNTSYYKNLVSLSKADHNNSSSLLVPDTAVLSFDPSDPETYFIGGKRFENPPVDPDPGSKWYIDSSEREKLSWSANLYPTYTNGPCYVISGNVVSQIYETSFSVPLYPFEDVYVVGMIAYDRLNLYISNIDGMRLNVEYLRYIRNKTFVRNEVAFHPVDHPAIMIKLCKQIPSCKKNLVLNKGTSSGARIKLSNVYSVAIGLTFIILMERFTILLK